jgi:hypothetical protein
MDQYKYKRILAVLAALLLIVAFGCGKSALGAEKSKRRLRLSSSLSTRTRR